MLAIDKSLMREKLKKEFEEVKICKTQLDSLNSRLNNC